MTDRQLVQAALDAILLNDQQPPAALVGLMLIPPYRDHLDDFRRMWRSVYGEKYEFVLIPACRSKQTLRLRKLLDKLP